MSIFERAGEHWTDRLNQKEDSHMIKHWVNDHADMPEPPKFQFKVVSSFKDALTRQVSEAVRIELRGGGVLNSKSEYNRCKIPRLTIDQEEWKKLKRTEQQVLDAQEVNHDPLEDGQDELFLMAGRDEEKNRRKDAGGKSSSNKRLKMAPLEDWGERVNQDTVDMDNG